jgi:TPP-dependent indolepyruvate ferredoxin oxidoreductase alpha subunit
MGCGVRAMVAMKFSGFNVAADFNGGKTSQPFAGINS